MAQFDDAKIKETSDVVVSKLGLSHPKRTVDTDLDSDINRGNLVYPRCDPGTLGQGVFRFY